MEQKHSLIIIGDMFPNEQNVSYFSDGDIDSLFGEEIVRLLVKADFCVCNLEGALSDNPSRCLKTGPIKVSSTSAVEAYKKLGIDMCLLANNHVSDGGHQGLMDTMQTLDDAGILHIGAGKNQNEVVHFVIKKVGGLNIGFYNVSETMYNKPTCSTAGVWLYDEYVVCRELEQLKKDCDYLIVCYHGGIEKFPYPSPEIRKRFYRMADSGADMILSQHSHCVGCEEYYNGSYLLYGQGDFLLKNFAPGFTDTGLVLEVVFEGMKPIINKHMVRSVEDKFARYVINPDFSSFINRSEKVHDQLFVIERFKEFCDKELRLYLTAFRNPSRLRLLQRRFFPMAYKAWLFSYRKNNLLFTLHTLRSEQNRETAIMGIEDQLGS